MLDLITRGSLLWELCACIDWRIGNGAEHLEKFIKGEDNMFVNRTERESECVSA